MILLFSIVVGLTSGLQCEYQWKLFGDKCYRALLTFDYTFEQAAQNCRLNEGVLASINTPEEMEFIHSINFKGKASGELLLKQPFVGYKDGKWIDKSTKFGVKWATGQPAPNTKCAKFLVDKTFNVMRGPLLFFGQSKVLVGVPCTDKTKTVLCQKPALPGDPPVSVPRTREDAYNSMNCGYAGWTGLKATKHCYKLFLEPAPITYDAAMKRCDKFGGKLTSWTNYIELSFLTNLGHTGGKYSLSDMPWIGYRKKGDKFVTEDGVVPEWPPLWSEYEPEGDDLCTQLITDIALLPNGSTAYDGKIFLMNTQKCTEKSRRFICKVPVDVFKKKQLTF